MSTQPSRLECIYPDWMNAYGDKFERMYRGQKGTVVDRQRVGGQPFVEFEEFPGLLFWAKGFKPARLDG